MKTLRQIENEIMEASKTRADELCGSGNDLMGITKNEIVAMQHNARMANKFVDLYTILLSLEKCLEGDDLEKTFSRKDLRQKFQKQLDAI
jgi:hypothetical protein